MNGDHVLDILTTEARPLILERFTSISCIASTRVAHDVCAAFGITCRPVVTEAAALNAEARVPFEEERPFTDEDVERGAQFVQTDLDPNGKLGGFPGHLVAIIDRKIVDLSADQMHRPAKRIFIIEPVVVPVDAQWYTGEQFYGKDLPFGGEIIYRKVAKPAMDYKQVIDWRDAARTRDIVARLVRRITETE